jgi:outer membrane protein W
VLIGVTFSANAGMKLKLRSDLSKGNTATFGDHSYQSNFNLQLPAEITAPGGLKDFYKGMLLLGILADVSFPFGDEKISENPPYEPGFKHIAGTGFSGHVMLSYAVAASVLLSIRAGYVSFGTQTQEESDEFFNQKYENCYSQIPILFGAYYLIATGSGFKPYLGLLLGAFIQSYKFTGTYTYDDGQFTQTINESADKSATAFGIVPALGFYYLLGSVMLHMAVEYAYLFSKLELKEGDYEGNFEGGELSKVSGFNGITAEDDVFESYSINYLSVLLGISIPLGGK